MQQHSQGAAKATNINILKFEANVNTFQSTYPLQLGRLDLGVSINACVRGSWSQLENVANELVLLQLRGHSGTHDSAHGRILMMDGPGI